MVDQRNIKQRNLSHSWIQWTNGHGHSGPRKQSISIIGSNMPSALGLVLIAGEWLGEGVVRGEGWHRHPQTPGDTHR